MLVYTAKRLLAGIPVILGVVTLVFLSMYFAPGDPVELLIPADSMGSAGEELVQQLRVKYGLDQPLHVQYFTYLQRVISFDLGESIRSGTSVAGELLQRYPATVELAVASLILGTIIGIPLGIVSAVNRNRLLDKASVGVSLLGISIPNFWLGLLLMLLFSLRLGWLPPSGRVAGFWTLEGLQHLIMPMVTLAIGTTGILTRLTRSAMLDVLGEDYIRTARAKGLREQTVIYRHAFRNALIPVVTVLGLQFGALLAGAVITESVFAWPGIGRYMILGIQGRDFPVVQGGVLFISVSFVLVNLLVDLFYALIDPRIVYS